MEARSSVRPSACCLWLTWPKGTRLVPAGLCIARLNCFLVVVLVDVKMSRIGACRAACRAFRGLFQG
jgi:hypothetical protein